MSKIVGLQDAADDVSRNDVKRLVNSMVSRSTKFQPGQLKGMRPQAENSRYSGSQIQNYSRRSNRAYQSLGTSKFDTFSSKTVRPSTSFMGVSRKEAIAKYSQFPKNLFNPMTDQMTSIVGHEDQVVERNAYFTTATVQKSNKQNCFARDV